MLLKIFKKDLIFAIIYIGESMKKIIIICFMLLLLTGCTNINKASVDDIANETINSKLNVYNTYRTGYKYYKPTNFTVLSSKKMNEILSDGKHKYYLYVDLVSYYKKTVGNYKIKNDAFISKDLTNNKKPGYIEVNVKNNKYLIEIMYNYAKIELIVDDKDINEAITNSLIILTTIKYNDEIIKNLMGEDVLSFGEQTFNIFDTNSNESNFLEYVQEYGNYEGEDNPVPDYDLI